MGKAEYGAVAGFAKSLSGSVSEAEQRRLDGEAQAAQNLKAESLSQTKIDAEAGAAELVAEAKVDAATVKDATTVSEGDLDRRSREKIAGISAAAKDPKLTTLTEEKAYELVFKDPMAQADPVEAKRRVDVLMGRAEPTPEEVADPEGWFSKKIRQVKEVFGKEETPPVAAPSITAPGAGAEIAPPAVAPQINVPGAATIQPQPKPETAQVSTKAPPQSHIDYLMKNLSDAKVKSDFIALYGSLPAGVK